MLSSSQVPQLPETLFSMDQHHPDRSNNQEVMMEDSRERTVVMVDEALQEAGRFQRLKLLSTEGSSCSVLCKASDLTTGGIVVIKMLPRSEVRRGRVLAALAHPAPCQAGSAAVPGVTMLQYIALHPCCSCSKLAGAPVQLLAHNWVH